MATFGLGGLTPALKVSQNIGGLTYTAPAGRWALVIPVYHTVAGNFNYDNTSTNNIVGSLTFPLPADTSYPVFYVDSGHSIDYSGAVCDCIILEYNN